MRRRGRALTATLTLVLAAAPGVLPAGPAVAADESIGVNFA